MTEKPDNETADEPEMPLYFGDINAGYANGLQLDLRARLAVDFIKSGLLAHVGMEIADGSADSDSARRIVAFALDLGTEYVQQSRVRGLSKPMPDHGELTQGMRLNIERQIRAQVYAQLAGQRIQREEMGPGIAPAIPGLIG